MRSMVKAFILCLLLQGVSYANEFKEGVDYLKLDQPQNTESKGKVEVLEFFWYGCPHCYQFEPILTGWIDKKPANVDFKRVPAVFRPEWKVHARTYYTMIALNLENKLHSEIFDEIHKRKRNLLDKEEAMFNFVAKQNIDKEEFVNTYKSFSVDGMMRKAIKQLENYKVRGVPAMAVNGKYLITGSTAKSYENMLRIVDFLVKQETTSQ